MSKVVLGIKGLSKSFDSVRCLSDFSCELYQGELLGLIGPNGAGKTTLFNVITGFIPPEQGKVYLGSNDITGISPYKLAGLGIARTFQNLRLIHQMSVLDNVLLAFHNQLGEKLINIFFRSKKIRYQEEKNYNNAIRFLEVAGIAKSAGDLVADLSYGQQKLLSLVCCIATGAKVLLLDEPVAGIAPVMIDKILSLISTLSMQGKSVILIEHNLDAVMKICNRVIFMDAGVIISEGIPEDVRNDPKVIDAYIE
ncbi:ABC transporter ATP-binding protein [Acidobacteriota bacterium]